MKKIRDLFGDFLSVFTPKDHEVPYYPKQFRHLSAQTIKKFLENFLKINNYLLEEILTTELEGFFN